MKGVIPALMLLILAAPRAGFAFGDLTLRYTSYIVDEKSFDPLADDDYLPTLDVTAGYDLDWLVENVSVNLSYEFSRKTDMLFGENETALNVHGAVLSGRYYYDPFEWLRTYGRAGFGTYFSTLSLKSGDDELESFAWEPGGLVGGGFDVYVPHRLLMDDQGERKFPFSLGFNFEAGYSIKPEFSFDVKQPEPEDHDVAKRRIPETSTGFGGLDLSGFYFKLGAAFIF